MTPEEITERLKDRSTWRDGWQTREGKPVRILCDDAVGDEYKVCGLYRSDGTDICSFWCRNGAHYDCDNPCQLDLIPRPVKHKGWLNVFLMGGGRNCYATIYPDKAQADTTGSFGRIACIEIEFVVGQGLDD